MFHSTCLVFFLFVGVVHVTFLVLSLSVVYGISPFRVLNLLSPIWFLSLSECDVLYLTFMVRFSVKGWRPLLDLGGSFLSQGVTSFT